jgi:hypothetical protein
MIDRTVQIRVASDLLLQQQQQVEVEEVGVGGQNLDTFVALVLSFITFSVFSCFSSRLQCAC